jgi:hypothetical protein
VSRNPQIPSLFSQIDRTNRGEYAFLEEADVRYYIWERMSQVKGDYYKYPANNFIWNFQIEMSYKKPSGKPCRLD